MRPSPARRGLTLAAYVPQATDRESTDRSGYADTPALEAGNRSNTCRGHLEPEAAWF